MTGSLDGFRALVIGGGSGIGLASARLLARDGAHVTISGRTASKLDAAAADFSARYLASYSAGKAAVDQLVRVAANELGEFGVRVNAVRPGLTRTPTTQGMFAHQPMLEAFLASQPIGRPGEADDIAQAVRYLLGPESSWVTGQLLTVDGGHTLRAFVNYADLIDIPDVRAAIAGDPPGGGRAPASGGADLDAS